MEKRNLLSDRISIFLKKYAKMKGVDYTSPDAYCLEKLAMSLKDKDLKIRNIRYPFSDIHNGAYLKKGFDEHEDILSEFEKLQNEKIMCNNCSNYVPNSNFCTECGSKLSNT